MGWSSLPGVKALDGDSWWITTEGLGRTGVWFPEMEQAALERGGSPLEAWRPRSARSQGWKSKGPDRSYFCTIGYIICQIQDMTKMNDQELQDGESMLEASQSTWPCGLQAAPVRLCQLWGLCHDFSEAQKQPQAMCKHRPHSSETSFTKRSDWHIPKVRSEPRGCGVQTRPMS